MKTIIDLLKENQKISHDQAFQKQIERDPSCSFLNIENTHSWARNYPIHMLKNYFELNKLASILTIGDGKGAHEAQILKHFGLKSTASDIAVDMVKLAYEKNLIDEYRVLDAEAMEIADNSYDFSIIKETLHHLPRPYLCIYEMLRISKKGCVFIEPNGDHCYKVENERYEASGNYKYQFTVKEFVQTAAAIGITNVAIGYSPNVNYILNCYCCSTFQPDVWASKDTRPSISELAGKLLPITIKYNNDFKGIKKDYQRAVDQWYYSHQYNINPLLVVIIQKIPFTKDERHVLDDIGFKLLDLKVNPYIKQN